MTENREHQPASHHERRHGPLLGRGALVAVLLWGLAVLVVTAGIAGESVLWPLVPLRGRGFGRALPSTTAAGATNPRSARRLGWRPGRSFRPAGGAGRSRAILSPRPERDGIIDQLAKYERAKIAERSRRGRLRKAREGKLLRNSRANYGFRHTEAGDAYEVHEEEMRVVRRIFRSVANGSTLYGVKRTLEAEGVPPPGNGSRGDKYWSAAYLRSLIQDDVYTPYPYAEIEPLVSPAVAASLRPSLRHGIYWFNRTRTTRKRVSTHGAEGRKYRWKYHVHKNPHEQWIAIPIPEAGIPRELVEAARETIRHNRPPGSTGRRVWQIPSGAVRCSGCGKSMTQYASAAGGRVYAYYRCARLARLGKGSCPSIEKPGSRKNHRAEVVEGLVWDFVSGLMKDPEQLREDLERMIELEASGHYGDPETAEQTWLEKLAELNGMRRGFQEQAARGLMTLDELGTALEGLEETRRTAEHELAAGTGPPRGVGEPGA